MADPIREQQQHNRSSSNSNITTMRSLAHPPHNPLRRHHHTQPLVLLLVLLFATLAQAFLVPLPASSSSYPSLSTTHPSSLASSRPTTTALPARYTSKDTGDRKKKARIRGFKSAKTGGASKRPGMTEEEIDYFDSPDGDEEVLEIAVDVEELMSFASNLEDALKGVARKDQTAPPPAVILNATNLHWLLGQVAYDTGVRQFCVPGLGHMKDSSALLPDDVEWILSSGVNAKSVRRLPAIEGVRAVYISNLDTALLLEEALRKEEHRLATRPSHNKVSRSRAKFLVAQQKKKLQEKKAKRKKEAEGEGGDEGGMEEGAEEELGFQLLKAVVLAPTSEDEDVMLLANAIRDQCPRLVLWGISLEKAQGQNVIDSINPLRSLLGRDPVVILSMEGGETLAKQVTKTQSLAWDSLATLLTVEAPLIEDLRDGIQPDVEEEEDEDEEEREGGRGGGRGRGGGV